MCARRLLELIKALPDGSAPASLRHETLPSAEAAIRDYCARHDGAVRKLAVHSLGLFGLLTGRSLDLGAVAELLGDNPFAAAPLGGRSQPPAEPAKGDPAEARNPELDKRDPIAEAQRSLARAADCLEVAAARSGEDRSVRTRLESLLRATDRDDDDLVAAARYLRDRWQAAVLGRSKDQRARDRAVARAEKAEAALGRAVARCKHWMEEGQNFEGEVYDLHQAVTAADAARDILAAASRGEGA